MLTVLLVIHLLISIALVGIVLLQKSEGGGLGMGGGGGGGGGMGGFMTSRATANLLTRTTAILAAAFMISSLTLAILGNQGKVSRSILDTPAGTSAPATPTGTTDKAPAKPAGPTVPLAK
ncbi:preprotein translocase subunit SecG [Varunaivibrio sulfuroxidans]|uniref:Protein-export membrane protein SecG n=1 Tax=Varunaivibrio sulfuroxidans TaxID=1773489 RepID=A0A4R3JE90_9PROT|nr:preprotein translocase subunit SecG [Varunaivibrio sulfuroxidans]TCS64192.1 protein translocase subunit secG [Varunaivibrio sulfuroxidans]WES31363.1 preprotein translocase subunit SecG [Varunaivibrio sulfuroxidans]